LDDSSTPGGTRAGENYASGNEVVSADRLRRVEDDVNDSVWCEYIATCDELTSVMRASARFAMNSWADAADEATRGLGQSSER
jgi:hypothetical protein